MADTVVDMGGEPVKLTNLTKVLYPLTRTRKADLIAYYAEVASVMLPHLAGRPVTRRRWPNGVTADSFFQKNVDQATPAWMDRQAVAHSDGDVVYPLVDSPAGLVWMAQNAALELHVPQWRFDTDGLPGLPDRLVFDLDPGPGVTLVDCAEVARMLRTRLAADGLELYPVTSGAKGLHLYAPIEPGPSSDELSDRAHVLAQEVERALPDRVTSRMTRSVRAGRIFIDWSQNNAAKTTVSPYSLRGRDRPTVACPRTWAELEEEDLGHLEYTEVLRRLDRIGDLLADLDPEAPPPRPGRRPATGASRAVAGPGNAPAATETAAAAEDPADPAGRASSSAGVAAGDAGPAVAERLAEYRAKRDAARTPEPVPGPDDPPAVGTGDGFVVQEHHAGSLHWDLRLERDGVLWSWALPKGVPSDTRQQRLAVQTEDHPLEYADFEGHIPAREYGGGRMVIWDRGRYRLEKWRTDEIIVTLQGDRLDGRYALIRTGDRQWLMRRTKGQAALEPVVPLTDAELDRRLGPAPESRVASPSADPGTGPSTGPTAGSADEDGPDRDQPSVAASVGGSDPDRESARDPDAVDDPTPSAARAASDEGPPTDLAPMLASPGRVADVATGTWRFEGKWDGLRALARVDGDLVLTSRTGRVVTALYPELQELTELLAEHRAVLDGELVVLDELGRSSFGLAQERMNLSRPVDVERVRRVRPVQFWVFDVLWLDGVSLLTSAYDLRRRVLEMLPLHGTAVRVPPALEPPLDAALALTAERGWEGVVAKRADSRYLPGRRSDQWLKFKHQRTQEVVVLGWTPGTGRRSETVGALLLGVPEAGQWRYVGKVGTGLSDAELSHLHRQLTARARDRGGVVGVPREVERVARWSEPALVAEVGFGEWSRTGVLRFPVWRGLRSDRSPQDVRIED